MLISKRNFKKIIFFFISYTFLIFTYTPNKEAYSYPKNSKEIFISNSFQNKKNLMSQYILGPGDLLRFKIIGINSEYLKLVIGPDGYIVFDEIDPIYAEGLTLRELRGKIIEKYKDIMFSPEIRLLISSYRPINIYIYGEVKRPGIYTLTGQSDEFFNSNNNSSDKIFEDSNDKKNTLSDVQINKLQSSENVFNTYQKPSLYDAIKASQGLFPYSDLSNIVVIRKNSIENGGGKLKTKVNFWKLFEEGDLSQNIYLQDGDTIFIDKSKRMLSEKLLKIASFNLNPSKIRIYVSGNVKNTGEIIIPQGSSLNQALARTGGKEILSGDIEFIRFDKNSFMEKRTFRYSSNAKVDSYKNPILISGDIINVKNSVLGYTTEVISKVTSPIIGVYSLVNLFD